ncbi:MAG: hypothetical protein ACP5H7_03430 [Minisyncoccia bacterium]
MEVNSTKKEIKTWSTGEKIEIKIPLTQEENKKIENILKELGFQPIRSVEEETDFVFLFYENFILKLRDDKNEEKIGIAFSIEKGSKEHNFPDYFFSPRISSIIILKNYRIKSKESLICESVDNKDPNLRVVQTCKEKRNYFKRGNLEVSHDINVKGIKLDGEKKEIKLGDFLEVTVSPENKKELDAFLEELKEKGIPTKIITQHYYSMVLGGFNKIRD